jgi:Ca-activated chloride channel family protein
MFTKRRLLLLGVAALLMLVQWNGPAQAQGPDEPQVHITQVDTSDFPTVTVYVSVTDSAGEPVGIRPEQLVLHENGVLIMPDQMVSGAGVVESLTTLLVIDVSGSMNTDDKLDTAKTAAHAYVDLMRAGDQVGVMAFNTSVAYVQPITSNLASVKAAIDSLVGVNDTAMYDALVEAADILAPVQGRKAIIVLTDGMDNMSQYGLWDVIAGIGPSGLSISTVGLGNPQESESYAGLDVSALMSLASEAGGEYAYANDIEGLTRLYERYARALQSEYVITYTSPGSLRDGLNRRLSVTLADAGAGGQETAYNPGGLVPEVGEPASWGLFLLALVLLCALLFLPSLIGLAVKAAGRGRKPKSRIRFKD